MREEAEDALRSAKKWTSKQWQDFHLRSREDAERMTLRLRQLRRRLSKVGQDVRDEVGSQLDDAQGLLSRMQERIESWQETGEETWLKVREQLSEGSAKIADTLDRAAQKLSNDEEREKRGDA